MNLLELESETATLPQDPDEMSDERLVSAAQSGDSSAFSELSKRHSKRILLKIYRITNNWQDAEDVLQESLMKAFIHLQAFECKASFSTWFTRIAINSALMALRKRRNFIMITIDSSSYDLPLSDELELRDHRDNPEQSYARRQREEILKRGIQRLRPAFRKVLELQQIDELSTKETARSVGISVSAVKSRVMRAKTALRQYVR